MSGDQNTVPALIEIGRGYFVHTNGVDPARFVNFFGMAASELAEEVCQTLEAHWTPVGPNSPRFELVPRPVILSDDGRSGGVAVTDENGLRVRFAADVLPQLPPSLGRDLILHELAHVHTFSEIALGVIDVEERRSIEEVIGQPERLNELMERLADERLEQWGFDPSSIRNWTEAHLRTLGLVE